MYLAQVLNQVLKNGPYRKSFWCRSEIAYIVARRTWAC